MNWLWWLIDRERESRLRELRHQLHAATQTNARLRHDIAVLEQVQTDSVERWRTLEQQNAALQAQLVEANAVIAEQHRLLHPDAGDSD